MAAVKKLLIFGAELGKCCGFPRIFATALTPARRSLRCGAGCLCVGVLELTGALGLGSDRHFAKSRDQSSSQAELGCESLCRSLLTISSPQAAGKRCQTSPFACAVHLSVLPSGANAFSCCDLGLSSSAGQWCNRYVRSTTHSSSWKCTSRAHLPL